MDTVLNGRVVEEENVPLYQNTIRDGGGTALAVYTVVE